MGGAGVFSKRPESAVVETPKPKRELFCQGGCAKRLAFALVEGPGTVGDGGLPKSPEFVAVEEPKRDRKADCDASKGFGPGGGSQRPKRPPDLPVLLVL